MRNKRIILNIKPRKLQRIRVFLKHVSRLVIEETENALNLKRSFLVVKTVYLEGRIIGKEYFWFVSDVSFLTYFIKRLFYRRFIG